LSGIVRVKVRVKYWEIIADNVSKAGWSWGCASAVDSRGQRIWIADAHRGDGKRFVVRTDEKLTAFVELESAIRETNFVLSALSWVKIVIVKPQYGPGD
jgi:hypothetical protein